MIKRSKQKIRDKCEEEIKNSPVQPIGLYKKRMEIKNSSIKKYWNKKEYKEAFLIKIEKHNRENPFYMSFARYYKWFVRWFFNYVCGIRLNSVILKRHSMNLYIVCLFKTLFNNVGKWIILSETDFGITPGRPGFNIDNVRKFICSVFGSEECFEFRRGQELIGYSAIRFLGEDKINSVRVKRLYEVLNSEYFENEHLKNCCYAETTIVEYRNHLKEGNTRYSRKSRKTKSEEKSEEYAAEMAKRLTKSIIIGEDTNVAVSISLPKTRFEKGLIYDNREITHGIPTNKSIRSFIRDKVHNCGIAECDLKASYISQTYILAGVNPPEDPYSAGNLLFIDRSKVKAIANRTISILAKYIYENKKISLQQLQDRSFKSYKETLNEYKSKNKDYPNISKKIAYFIIKELLDCGLRERLEKITSVYKVPAYYVFMHNEQQVVRMSRELAMDILDNDFWCYGNNDSVIISEFYKDEFLKKCFIPTINTVFNRKMRYSVK